jgi:predicted nucleotidyltransferase
MISLRSSITRDILSEMFLHPERPYYAEEWVRGSGSDRGNLSRKLKELVAEGLLVCELKGKEIYYRLNRSYPLLGEYRRILMKSVGAEAQIRKMVRSVPGVQSAFLFGSYAEDRMDASSDIDLMVVGEHDTLELQKQIAQLQKKLTRELNVISLSPSEYEKKLKTHPFFKRLIKLKKIQIV